MQLFALFMFFALVVAEKIPTEEEVTCGACEITTRRLTHELQHKPDHWKAQRTKAKASEVLTGLCERLPTMRAIALSNRAKAHWHWLRQISKDHDHLWRFQYEPPHINAWLMELCDKLIEPNRKKIADYIFYNMDLDLRNQVCVTMTKSCKSRKDNHPAKANTIQVDHHVHIPEHLDEPPLDLSRWQKSKTAKEIRDLHKEL